MVLSSVCAGSGGWSAGRQSGLNPWQDQSKELPGGGRIGLGGGGDFNNKNKKVLNKFVLSYSFSL